MNKIKASIHLIATDKYSYLVLQRKILALSKTVEYVGKSRLTLNDGVDPIPQHLYITTDEKIKEGDWCLHFGKDFINNILFDKITLVRVTEKYSPRENNEDGYFWKQWDKDPQFSYSHNELRKILATTNSELWWQGFRHEVDSVRKILVPKIPTLFIEQYIKAYNEGSPIKEVWLQVSELSKSLNEWRTQQPQNNSDHLGLAPDGCVIVIPVEERMYTKEELENAFNSGAEIHIEDYKNFSDWFNKNY